jgi:signal transduction histidine kinase
MRCWRAFAAVDLGQTLQQVYELYAPLAEDQSLQFTLEAESNLLAQADPDLLFEAIGNLVSNAIKFTPPGGRVTLHARRDTPGTAQIEVMDSGPGIPEAQRHAVWQRFYRGEGGIDTAAGHGLGLSIVAAIARLHDFDLRIEGGQGGTHMVMTCRCFTAV